MMFISVRFRNMEWRNVCGINTHKSNVVENKASATAEFTSHTVILLFQTETLDASFLFCFSLEFKEEVLRNMYEEEMGSQVESRARMEMEEHRSLMAWNDQENLRTLQARILRVQKEEEEAQHRKMELALQREEEQQEFIKQREKEILQLQEDAKNFITLQNLDQRIEEALDNPKNYNFAVDKEGRVVKRTVLQ
uniref:Small ribosomal subunit protein mS26 n=1 Tax=Nothobranchius furzeri TaxID=105023 RepID=A0A8C6MBC5_NOTFU